jgi:hypothetical protein
MYLKRREFFIGVENRVFQHNRPVAAIGPTPATNTTQFPIGISPDSNSIQTGLIHMPLNSGLKRMSGKQCMPTNYLSRLIYPIALFCCV